uniref:RE46684p n=1 Tax=Drosophila melanogaster TaxID=7227 RepID=Q6NP75_DROME|nr:RE46684p [Drosophila melanogaster]
MGTGGCRRSDSLITFSINFSSPRSRRVTGLFRSSPRTSRISCCRRCWTSGCLEISYKQNEIAEVVVSWPSNINVSTSSRISSSLNGAPSIVDCSSTSSRAIRRFWPKKLTSSSGVVSFELLTSVSRRSRIMFSVKSCITLIALSWRLASVGCVSRKIQSTRCQAWIKRLIKMLVTLSQGRIHQNCGDSTYHYTHSLTAWT